MTAKKQKFGNYVYVRLDDGDKDKLKEIARKDGSNMTVFIRRLIIKAIRNA